MAFPVNRLVPKDETLASDFLHKYPECDGRNVTVAILDTGVDPGAVGLQTTPQGQRKIVDIIDATGSGDINMTHKITGSPTTGLSGRALVLNPTWTSTEFRLGLKFAYELFPAQLVTRMTLDRKEKWLIEHRNVLTEVSTKLNNITVTKDMTAAEVATYNDLKAQQTYLNTVKFDDVGPYYDCISFHDGTQWRGAISATGDFTECDAMADYATEYAYATFCDRSLMNYCLKFYDDGDVMCIVCDAGAHGSHVAGIVAAYHPDEVINNGIAPGAQIVAIKIGDARLGSMETGVGLVRALIAVLKHNCDVINLSYGEFSSRHNSGRIIALAQEIVETHNVVFVSSAGNSGPALTTVGAPGGSSACILGVGAYVSPPMMDTEYTMDHQTVGTCYTWSSRGPTFDGDLGVNVCAPGGAITTVPNWTLQKCRLMNGTSMSSPNAAGNVALLISGLKEQKIPYTPYSIRAALENTAVKVPNVEAFAQGRGLIQITNAFEFCQKFQFGDAQVQPLYYNVSVGEGRGILLREFNETTQTRVMAVGVHPKFHKKAPQSSKVAFEMRVKLVCTVPWISTAEYLQLAYGGRSFNATIKCEQLSAGESYYGEILGLDSTNQGRGAVFRIPVTIIKPKQPTSSGKMDIDLCAAKVHRTFLRVPSHANWVDVHVTRTDTTPASRLYVCHLLQALPHTSQSNSSVNQAFRLDSTKDPAVISMAVTPDVTLELCMAQYWNSIGVSTVQVSVQFRGVCPDKEEVTLHGGEGFARILLRSELQSESVLPVATLSHWQQRLRPDSFVITPLTSARDLLPDGRTIYQLILTFKVEKAEDGTIRPRLPLLNDVLYEASFESQLCMVFDDQKKYIGCSDAFGNDIKLTAGSYVIKVQVRHDDMTKLTPLSQMVLLLEHALKDKLNCPVHPTRAGLSGEESAAKTSAVLLAKGMAKAFFIGEPAFEKIPKTATSGDLLVGSISYRKEAKNPTPQRKFVFKYNIPAAEVKPKEVTAKVEEIRSTDEEAIRDVLVARLKEIKESKPEEFAAQFDLLVGKYPKHLPLLQCKLQFVKTNEEIVAAADAIINAVDADALILHFGTKSIAEEDLKGKQDREQKSKERDCLIEALQKKAVSLGGNDKELFMQNYKAFQKWADPMEDKYATVSYQFYHLQKQYGLALACLMKCRKMDTKERRKVMSDVLLQEKLDETLTALGWNHALEMERATKIFGEPKEYTLF